MSPRGGAPFRYRAYGLAIVSDVELRGLPTDDGWTAGDEPLVIARVRIDDPAIAGRRPMIFVNRGDEQFLAWSAVGAFRIPSDDRIEVHPNEDAPDSLVALPLLGAVLATLLHRRGLMVLHASAVAVNGVAVALLGDKGAGKSTTAGALIAGGHRLISDDIVAVDFGSPGDPVVRPAYGELKLWDDSGIRLSDSGITKIGRLHPTIEKAHYSLAGNVVSEPLPLRRIYVLDRSASAGIRPLQATEALGLLLRHAYMARFAGEGFGAAMPTFFRRAGQVVRQGRVQILDAPLGLDRIAEIPGLVEADLAGTARRFDRTATLAPAMPSPQ